jgi:hypothetical protein
MSKPRRCDARLHRAWAETGIDTAPEPIGSFEGKVRSAVVKGVCDDPE